MSLRKSPASKIETRLRPKIETGRWKIAMTSGLWQEGRLFPVGRRLDPSVEAFGAEAQARTSVGTKLECPLFSVGLASRFLSLPPIGRERGREKTKPNEAIEVN